MTATYYRCKLHTGVFELLEFDWWVTDGRTDHQSSTVAHFSEILWKCTNNETFVETHYIVLSTTFINNRIDNNLMVNWKSFRWLENLSGAKWSKILMKNNTYSKKLEPCVTKVYVNFIWFDSSNNAKHDSHLRQLIPIPQNNRSGLHK